jgi:Fe2+ or Zn2+ uptake regulation protein
VVFEVPGDRAVLLTATGDELITLNRVGTVVWLSLEHPRSADEIVADLRDAYPGVSAATLEADLERFVDEMVAAGLLVHDAAS